MECHLSRGVIDDLEMVLLVRDCIEVSSTSVARIVVGVSIVSVAVTIAVIVASITISSVIVTAMSFAIIL